MKAIKRGWIGIMSLVMLGCATHSLRPHLAACQSMCQERLKHCYSTCTDSCRRCSFIANAQAREGYRKYRHEQCVRGGFIVRQLQSYRDPLKCQKATCNCEADYRICAQACSGTIDKRLQAEEPS